jgi:hypothetical protein
MRQTTGTVMSVPRGTMALAHRLLGSFAGAILGRRFDEAAYST